MPGTKRFGEIFDGKRPIHPGLLPIWFLMAVLFFLHPSFTKLPPVAGLVVPFGLLIVLEQLYRFGEWLEYRMMRGPSVRDDLE